ncbi:MAG: hypothetical protein RXQ94_04985 [Caldivirga sp.]
MRQVYYPCFTGVSSNPAIGGVTTKTPTVNPTQQGGEGVIDLLAHCTTRRTPRNLATPVRRV